jgi:hypothetical protein
MFEALGQVLAGDHLDLSYTRSAAWPRVGPADGMPPSLWISVGDPISGPAVQLGICAPAPAALWLDTHYHGSDQFRAALRGDFQLQRKHMVARDFGYQHSGVPYREGLLGGCSEDLWMFAVQGDRRGARATITRADGTFMLGEIGEDQLDRPVASPDDVYWTAVPGGARGVSALALAPGRLRGGFAWGTFDDTREWHPLADGVTAAVGVLGDAATGPVIFAVHCEPGGTAIPAGGCGTERIVTIVRGDCTIADQRYALGDLRIQNAGAAMPAVTAGGSGLDCILMVADRRAMPDWTGTDSESQRWLVAAGALLEPLIDAVDQRG